MPKAKPAPAKPDVTTMTPEQYNTAREALGLSIVGARRTFKFSKRQAQRLSYGEAVVPGPLAILLRIMVKDGIKVEDLEGYAA